VQWSVSLNVTWPGQFKRASVIVGRSNTHLPPIICTTEIQPGGYGTPDNSSCHGCRQVTDLAFSSDY
jgi:hypothetical protein